MKRNKWMRVFLVTMGMGVCLSAFSAPKGVAVRLNVKGDLDKERSNEKDEKENKSTRSKLEEQCYTLSVQVVNTSRQPVAVDLECYFVGRRVDSNGKKGDRVICEKTKETLEIAGQKKVSKEVVSKVLSSAETVTSSSVKTKKSYSGSVYSGYIVVVRYEGEIVAKMASDTKYLSEQWLGKLAQTPKGFSNTKKKRKKK